MFVTTGSRISRKRVTGSNLSLPLVGNGLTYTVSTPLLNLSQTWNNAAVAFTGLQFNVTNTASAAPGGVQSSRLISLTTGGSNTFSVSTDNMIRLGSVLTLNGNGASTLYVGAGTAGTFMFGYAGAQSGQFQINDPAAQIIFSTDLFLYRDAANILAQRNGVNANTFRVYNTFTDAANYERGVFDWQTTANVLTIGTQALGTGTARNLQFFAGGANRLDYAVTNAGMWTIPASVGLLISSSVCFSGSLLGDIVSVSTGRIGFAPAANPNNPPDTLLTRAAAAALQHGAADAAAPVAQTLQVQSVVAGTTNTAGADWTFVGSKGTGTGKGGDFVFQAAPVGLTGTAQNAAAEVCRISNGGVLTLAGFFSGSIRTSQIANLAFNSVAVSIDNSGNAVFGGWSVTLAATVNNFVEIRNATNAQALRVYNTYTDAANYERGVFDWQTTANTLTIGTQAGGTGSARNVRALGSVWVFDSSITDPNGYWSILAGASGYIGVGDTVPWKSGISTGAGFSASISQVPGLPIFQIGNGVTHDRSGYINWGGEANTTANFTSSTATLTAITGLSSVVIGSSRGTRNYSFEAWLAVTGSSLAGVQVGITCTSSTITTLVSDGFMLDAGVIRGSSVGVIASTGTPVVAVSSATTTSSNPSIRINGMIRVASSGTFGLTVAQSTASATQTVVSSASWLLVYDMP